MNMKRASGECTRHILMTGFAGAAGTHMLAESNPDILAGRFSLSYTDRIRNVPVPDHKLQNEIISIVKTVSGEENVSVFPAGEGGIYAALWNLGEEMKSGLSVRLKSIPICQETIEVCNLLDRNPYMIDSGGSLLIVCTDPETVLDDLGRRNIEAADIGCLTSELKRVIVNGEDERFLTRPVPDEINRFNIKK